MNLKVMKENNCYPATACATDLLTDKKHTISFTPEHPTEIVAPALGGLILTF